jgi:hypothetical protein
MWVRWLWYYEFDMHSNAKTPVTLRDYKPGAWVLYALGHWPIKGRYFSSCRRYDVFSLYSSFFHYEYWLWRNNRHILKTCNSTLILHMEDLFYNIYDSIALLFLIINFETRGCYSLFLSYWSTKDTRRNRRGKKTVTLFYIWIHGFAWLGW